ncbi:MAG TPA: TraB/GumN family protein, partial [Bryobacteraceae bacterium]|nr:TraB/GumN family protein [Bryobacteraceae bacterium]
MTQTAFHRTLRAFALSFLGLAAAAQDTRVLTLPAPPPARQDRPVARAHTPAVQGLMWKATSPTNTVYLVGSLHFGTPDMYPLPETIQSAFQKSSALVVEIDLNKVGPAEAFRFMA